MIEHDENGTRHGFAVYHDDGIDLMISPDGLPKAWHIIPAPMLSEEYRQERFARARRAFWLEGLYIERERPIRNPAFDKRGEKTSLRVVARVCKNHAEALEVLGHIREIIADDRSDAAHSPVAPDSAPVAPQPVQEAAVAREGDS